MDLTVWITELANKNSLKKTFVVKHPISLGSNYPAVRLFFVHFYAKHCNQGVQYPILLIQQEYLAIERNNFFMNTVQMSRMLQAQSLICRSNQCRLSSGKSSVSFLSFHKGRSWIFCTVLRLRQGIDTERVRNSPDLSKHQHNSFWRRCHQWTRGVSWRLEDLTFVVAFHPFSRLTTERISLPVKKCTRIICNWNQTVLVVSLAHKVSFWSSTPPVCHIMEKHGNVWGEVSSMLSTLSLAAVA